MPKRIQRKRVKGWRMPEGCVSVTRPGRWGNPFPVDVFGRERALELYRMWVGGEWCKEMYPHIVKHELRFGVPSHNYIRMMLKGLDLACYCKPDEACHADILLEIANA